jgi:outer membrane protein TolC
MGGIAALAWLAGSFPGAAAARDLTLVQCIDLAVAQDPDTRNAKQSVEVGRLKRSRAVQEFYPKLDAYITQGPQTDYYGRPVTDKNVYYTGVGMEQPLYRGGTLVNGLKLAESETRRSEFLYLTRKLGVAADAIKAYYQSLTAQETIRQYETLARHGEEDLREASARLEVGKGTRVEVLELSVKLLEVQQKLGKARAQYQVEISNLRKLTGLDGDEPLSLVPGFPLLDIRSGLPELISEAQVSRPDLKYGREDETYNQLRTDIEAGKRYPKLSLVARQEWENPSFWTGKKDWLVMLKASITFGNSTMSYSEQRSEQYPNIYAYPALPPPYGPGQRTYAFSQRSWQYTLFDKSSNRVELEEARVGRDLAHDRLMQTSRQVYYDIKNALAQKEDSAARMTTAKKQIEMARELVGILRTKYGVGYATLAEVFKARATLAEAEVSLATAQNDQAVALGKLYQVLGRDLTYQGSGS